MSKQFEQMTVAELRAYAEQVQAEYEADEISGPNGRQIVRDAWERVEQAERNAAVKFCLDQAQRASKQFIVAVADGGFGCDASIAALATLRHYVNNAKRLNNR